jgi:hypothetical protein
MALLFAIIHLDDLWFIANFELSILSLHARRGTMTLNTRYATLHNFRRCQA